MESLLIEKGQPLANPKPTQSQNQSSTDPRPKSLQNQMVTQQILMKSNALISKKWTLKVGKPTLESEPNPIIRELVYKIQIAILLYNRKNARHKNFANWG